MIVVVCLNPALDLTYHVDALVRGESLRVTAVAERAGGKGVNVARVLAQLGAPACLIGFADEQHASMLSCAELDARWTPIAAQTRRTVTVIDGEATVLREPGPLVADAEWAAFDAGYRALLTSRPDVVVLSGSLPLGLALDTYALLIEAAETLGVPCILDAEGDALRHGLAARPYLAKPNAGEARQLGEGDPLETVMRAGARNAVVSAGRDGLRAALDGRTFKARVPTVAGNPTGAGDALTAVLAHGIAAGQPWSEVLRQAAATAAAAATAPVAGEFDPAVAASLLPRVTVEEI